MNIQRIVKPLLTSDGQARRLFPRSALLAIEHAIKESEVGHDGEVRIAIEGALEGQTLFQGQSARRRGAICAARWNPLSDKLTTKAVRWPAFSQ